MHIVDITMFYPAESGGVGTYLSAKANWFAQRRRIAHTVVAPSATDGVCKHLDLVAVPSIPLPGARGMRMPLPTKFAERTLCRLRPDLIEVGDPYHLAWAAVRAKKALGVPAVAFYHTDLPRLMEQRFGDAAGQAARRYLRRLYRHFDLVLAPSRSTVQRLHELGIGPVRYQPLGVDTTLFHPRLRDDKLRAELGLPHGTRLLLFAGRFTREKKLPLLIDAVEHLGPPYHLVLAGPSGPLRESASVTWLPFQRGRALARLMASVDALVHAGDRETFGLVVLEAMASGIPVVGVRAGGVAELVCDDCGILVEPGRAEAMVHGIRSLYNRDLRAMGRAARERVTRQYDWQVIMPQLLRQYASLLSAGRRAELEHEACLGIN